MKTFKQFLTNVRFDPSCAKEQFHRMESADRQYILNDDNTISSTKSIEGIVWDKLIQKFEQKVCLNVKFKYVQGNFDMKNEGLETMIGCPDGVYGGNFDMWGNNLSDLQGIPSHVDGFIDLSHNDKLTSLKDIHKLVKHCRSIHVPQTLESNLLGVLLIKGMRDVKLFDMKIVPDHKKNIGRRRRKPQDFSALRLAIEIINKHLREDKDVLECQEELITAGLKKYANI